MFGASRWNGSPLAAAATSTVVHTSTVSTLSSFAPRDRPASFMAIHISRSVVMIMRFKTVRRIAIAIALFVPVCIACVVIYPSPLDPVGAIARWNVFSKSMKVVNLFRSSPNVNLFIVSDACSHHNRIGETESNETKECVHVHALREVLSNYFPVAGDWFFPYFNEKTRRNVMVCDLPSVCSGNIVIGQEHLYFNIVTDGQVIVCGDRHAIVLYYESNKQSAK